MTFDETIREAEILFSQLAAEAKRQSTPISKVGVSTRLTVLADLQTRLDAIVTLLESIS